MRRVERARRDRPASGGRATVRGAARLAGAAACLIAGCSTEPIDLSPVSGELTVVFADDAPDGIDKQFADAASFMPADDKKLALRAPNHEALLPRNVPTLLVAWRAEKALDRFEVELASKTHTLRFYGTERAWQPSANDFARLLAADGRDTRLSLRLRGLASDDPKKRFEAEASELTIGARAVEGELLFWSTVAQGIMRASVASLSSVKFFPPPQSANKDANKDGEPAHCVGCHTLSRDGRRLAFGYDGELLRELELPSATTVLPRTAEASPREYGWGTFDPGATRLLYAHHGALTVLDADSGAELFSVALPEGKLATHPDWAPDGRHVVVSLIEGKHDDNASVEHASIARIPVAADGKFGEPQVLASAIERDETLVFPAYSPDSAWVAFARVRGKSKDQKHAEIWLVAADGSGEPFALERLNHRVGRQDDGKDLGNTMPTWGPTDGAGRYWLAFSSSRDVGEEHLDDKRDQLWLAAIDNPLAAGELGNDGRAGDPSHPAFWLPFQRLDDSNHRAFFAVSADACTPSPERCDELDDDCDGHIDEDCCTPEPEICGDGVDNDCDGERDEACGCGLTDACSDGIDGDCDLRIDEDCLF